MVKASQVRLFILIITGLVLILSAVMIFFGAFAYSEIHKDVYSANYDNIIYGKRTLSLSNSYDPSIMIMVAGVLLFIMAACGMIGALRENVPLLKIYIVALVVVFGLEIIAVLLGVLYDKKISEKTKDAKGKQEKLFTDGSYRSDIDIMNFVDIVQKHYKCCGWNSYHDWENNRYFKCGGPSPEECGVPHSCCTQKEYKASMQCGWQVRRLKKKWAAKVIHTQGCGNKLPAFLIITRSEIVNSSIFKYRIYGYIHLALACIPVLAIIGSYMLIRAIKKESQVFEQSQHAGIKKANSGLDVTFNEQQGTTQRKQVILLTI